MPIRIPWCRFIKYFSSKLFGVGIGLLVFYFMFTGFNPEVWSAISRELIGYPVWTFFYGYALLFSILADYLACLTKRGRGFFLPVFYLMGGFVPFFWWDTAVVVIAGSVGAFMSMIVFGASFLIRKHWRFSGIGAGLLLLFHIVLIVSY
ncbi:hypothetical protein [Paenibacillus sp. YAF4_2]|uniref:hypothetical protein n=1 Tax=Paenibacillus sp. YAF4_2 TaxID=3233085 RepID=UPI003F95479F